MVAAVDIFRTYTGRSVSVLDPHPEDVCFEDIARALSRIQRFGGHCHSQYSVAEHSVLVSHLCRPRNAILGLLHDASEAYVGDVITPLKKQLPDYKEIERRWCLAIGRAAGVGDALANLPVDVHIADAVALQTERRDLFHDGTDRIDPEGPQAVPGYGHFEIDAHSAYKMFCERFFELAGLETF